MYLNFNSFLRHLTLTPHTNYGNALDYSPYSTALLKLFYSVPFVNYSVTIHKFPRGAPVKNKVGETSGEAAEVAFQWYFVC